MNIIVVGPGAMGCLFAAYLTRAGHEVTLFDHRRERVCLINQRGVRVETPGGELTLKVPDSLDYEKASQASLALICVKSYNTSEAVREVAGFLTPRARVLTLQNGVGNVEKIAQVVGPERTWGGVTSQGANVLGPGHIRHAGQGHTTIGPLGDYETERVRLEEAAQVLTQAGFPATVEAQVAPLIWSKLIVNVGINPLAAITGLKNGQLLEHEPTRRLMESAVNEAMEIIRALGIELIYPDALDRVREVARQTADNVASMLQDIRAKRPTEIEAINGAIVRHGRELGLAAPVNQTLSELVKALEDIG